MEFRIHGFHKWLEINPGEEGTTKCEPPILHINSPEIVGVSLSGRADWPFKKSGGKQQAQTELLTDFSSYALCACKVWRERRVCKHLFPWISGLTDKSSVNIQTKAQKEKKGKREQSTRSMCDVVNLFTIHITRVPRNQGEAEWDGRGIWRRTEEFSQTNSSIRLWIQEDEAKAAQIPLKHI